MPLAPINGAKTQQSETTRIRLEELFHEAATRVAATLPEQLNEAAQRVQDRCLRRHAEHFPQLFLNYFSDAVSQIENPILKFAFSPFVAAWAAFKTFYDAAGMQRSLVESQFDSAPFRLLYINTDLLDPLEICPRTIRDPYAVSKGGASDHNRIISEVRGRMIAHFGFDLIHAISGNIRLNGDQIFTALFDVLTTQLKGRMWPEQYPLYQAALAEYIEPRLAAEGGTLTMSDLFDKGYRWVLDFKEEIDIAENGESTGEFATIRETAQGPFASTCGVYAILSIFEAMGQLEAFKEEYNVHTYADLDRTTFELMKPYAPLPQIYRSSNFRSQGMGVRSAPDLANEIPQKLGINERFSFSQVAVEDDLDESFFRRYRRYGFIAAISTDVGPHAVHVLGYDRRSHMVRYYDPIGADGRDNVKELSLDEFNAHRLTQGAFALLTIVEPIS